MIVGDLNIAPLEHDVWSHKQLLGVIRILGTKEKQN